jgi:hypothetical protein
VGWDEMLEEREWNGINCEGGEKEERRRMEGKSSEGERRELNTRS